MALVRFPLLYGRWRWLLVSLGMGPDWSGIELDAHELHVYMGWAFRLRVPRAHVRGAKAVTGPVGGVGVHGWRGRWLVNGSMRGIVAIDIDPPARATAVGLPASVHRLAVSAEDPGALVAALATRA